jgi:hypothetical protein
LTNHGWQAKGLEEFEASTAKRDKVRLVLLESVVIPKVSRHFENDGMVQIETYFVFTT